MTLRSEARFGPPDLLAQACGALAADDDRGAGAGQARVHERGHAVPALPPGAVAGDVAEGRAAALIRGLRVRCAVTAGHREGSSPGASLRARPRLPRSFAAITRMTPSPPRESAIHAEPGSMCSTCHSPP